MRAKAHAAPAGEVLRTLLNYKTNEYKLFTAGHIRPDSCCRASKSAQFYGPRQRQGPA